MDFDEYRKLDAVNFSTLKEMRRSPMHYRHRLSEEREDSPRLAMGRATHTAVFEPDRFVLDYVIWSGGDRRGNAWAAFCEQHPDQTILKTSEYETCLAMRDAVRSHPVAGPALTPPGEAEKVLVWTDERTGLLCKGRLDWWRPGLLADLKTTGEIEARRFSALVERMGYHAQLSFYRAGLLANGLDAPPPCIIAVEAAAPHDVAVFELDDDAVYAGEVLVADLLSRVAAGRFSGMWPGRYPEKRALSLPAWAFESDDGSLDALGLEATGTEG